MKYKDLILEPDLPERGYIFVKEMANMILKKFEGSTLKIPIAGYSETLATQPISAWRKDFKTKIMNQ
jgi:hypothetical protein